MAQQTLSDWLKSRGIDEATLAPERHAQLSNFWKHDCAEKAAAPATALDADGKPIQIGDTITLTLKISAIGIIPDDLVNNLIGRKCISLSRPLQGGVDHHMFTVDSVMARKA